MTTDPLEQTETMLRRRIHELEAERDAVADRLGVLADKIHDTFNPTEDDVIELRAVVAMLRGEV